MSPRSLRLLPALLLLAAAPAFAQEFRAVEDRDFVDRGQINEEKVELGRFLFFDKILSGNRNISCATCHHPLAATSDGLSLPVGEGGRGLGITRDTGRGRNRIHERVPRNSPALFNLGAREFKRMFHDGRVIRRKSESNGFVNPAGVDLPEGLENILAAQAMFPVTSATEMAGQPGENAQADAAHAGRLAGPDGVWEIIAARLRSIPEYVELFRGAFGDVEDAEDITFAHAATAIAAFEAAAWRADDSPFDRYLRGERGAMSATARRGMQLFYGAAGCSSCHAGPFQTDHGFHAIAMPQIGPGKGDGPDGRDDFGLERVSGRRADRYKFRTPSLRHVAQTGPWGHAGAYDSLEEVVRHHLDPVAALYAWDRSQVLLPSRPNLDRLDSVVMDDPDRVAAIAAANELEPMALSDRQVADLIEFLRALSDPSLIDLRHDVPTRVPSGLDVRELLPVGGQ